MTLGERWERSATRGTLAYEGKLPWTGMFMCFNDFVREAREIELAATVDALQEALEVCAEGSFERRTIAGMIASKRSKP